MRRKIQQEEERMRGVETRIQEIRHAIFTEVAKMAYDVDSPVEKTIEEIPYRVIPGEVGNFRNDVFLERAIVGERLRLAMGLPCRSAAEHAPISDNIKLADQAETYYTPPLINVIKFACNACHEKRVLIKEGCQGCLAHPCVEVCPKKAITLDRTNGRSYIDQDKCVKCGQCAKVCGYQAIIIQERPCARACLYRLGDLWILRPVSRQLPVRRYFGQIPDLPGNPCDPVGRARLCSAGTGVCRPVRTESNAWKTACGDEKARLCGCL